MSRTQRDHESAQRRPLVLVVDDEEGLRVTLKAILSRDGYEVETAADVSEALTHLQSRPFDVVLTDIVMPGASGVALLETLSEDDGPAVIMMTGEPSMATATASIRAGAFDYVPKPVSRENILAITARAARWKYLRDEQRRMEKRLAIYRDHLEHVVEDQKESIMSLSRQNQIILDNISEGIIGVDLSGRITFANPAMRILTGHEELVGLHYHQLHSSTTAVECEFCDMLLGPSPASTSGAMSRADGSQFRARLAFAPAMDGARKIGGIVVVLDLTAAERANEERVRLAVGSSRMQIEELLGAYGPEISSSTMEDFGTALQAILERCFPIDSLIRSGHVLAGDDTETLPLHE